MNFSDAQKEIQDLLHNKEGWNVTVLARKRVLVQTLERFISYCEQHVNEVIE